MSEPWAPAGRPRNCEHGQLSQTQLRSPPGSSLRVEPDFVTSFHPDPPRNRMLWLLFFGQESLDSESLVRRRGEKPNQA